MCAFWNALKQCQKKKPSSSLCAEQFAVGFSKTMNDAEPLIKYQSRISDLVESRFDELKGYRDKSCVTQVDLLISKLKV